ncbi:glycoside hydrolase family 2 protein [Paenibacillus ginsengarvi]|uniref:Glycoside hydrolase family 2 n=1 Tax=Paenibacillus ginsengarvi TaxID=400777 RepID=A0A3B0AR25_9BACL|nr:sugar-binding domain-containing protein [Paenibacillus ginsengarvi]RKN62891.1 glycoside hydrolase family 2 [Paenibacillus ginsengarvi]
MLTAIQTNGETLVPRPEYPRPDWERADWHSLNGTWSFRFEPAGTEKLPHDQDEATYDEHIVVPFSWSSPLSGIERKEKGAGWYRRIVRWSPAEIGSRLFLRFGAVDYSCEVWINDRFAGAHTGGYGAFEFDVTDLWRPDGDNVIVLRAEDSDDSRQTRGKQGYGELRGIWQPVWLEARPQNYVAAARFVTRIDGRIEVTASIRAHQTGKAALEFEFGGGAVRHLTELELTSGDNEVAVVFSVHDPKLWSPESPYLYEGHVRLASACGVDTVATYFGIREIGTARFGERNYRWITLNGKPIYLNGALDQSYNATGYFTYPTDADMRDDIYLMKRLGLNFCRMHIKLEEPRKLYWADKLGLMVMQDMPCFWGNPDDTARAQYEAEAKEMFERDINHPSIFSWVMFNETWGLKTDDMASDRTRDWIPAKQYLPETQKWVLDVYRWAKRMDPTRLVEDNSPCNWDHVESDLNTWHFYKNGYEEVRSHIAKVVDETYPGSPFNYCEGYVQSDAPLMNSECGNVWGIEGGAGDSDLAWHYRYMMNEFRRHDKLCGFVFTEFRDVINEFNGYYRLNGEDKLFGYESFVPGMTLADLHAQDFIVIDAPPCVTADAGTVVETKLLRSSFSDCHFGKKLRLDWELSYDNLGTRHVAERGSRELDWDGYGVSPLAPLSVRLPDQDAVAVLAIRLLTEGGEVVSRNFTTFDVRSGKPGGAYEASGHIASVPVSGFTAHTFPHQWNALRGHKTNGGPEGEFEFEVALPDREQLPLLNGIEILFEAGAKRLLLRNTEKGETYVKSEISFMHGADANTERNPNTYYMTDEQRHESRVRVLIDGEEIGAFILPDDPADSRGVLSWHYQQAANKLEEAGSYGYLCKTAVPGRIVSRLDASRKLKLTLRAGEGGLALYGRNAGRYPIDLLFRCE